MPEVADVSQLSRHQVRIGPVPDWIRPSTADLNYQAKRRGALTYLLIDRQIHAELNQTFVRLVMRLETIEAVQHQSQWQLPFEPATQAVVIHSIIVRRGDTSLDRMRLDKMRCLQREEGLEKLVLDGWFTLLLLLDDVRPGDILEWSYTITARPRLLPEYCCHLFTLPLGLDIGAFNFAVRYNRSRQLRWKSGSLDVRPVESVFGDERHWSWSGSNFSTADLEVNMPECYVGYPWVQISDCPDWATVARAAASAWDQQKRASEADIRGAVRDIEANHPTLLARVDKAIELIQDDFRYLSVNLDFGGHIPTPSNLVLERRFGDCKDLSLLLSELLKALGISARPVLVATDLRKAVADMLPMPGLFNHAVVEFSLEDKTIWVDVTMKRQGGGALNRFIADFGVGLPVDPSASEIVMAPRNGTESLYEVKESILLDTTGRASQLAVNVRATGRFADALRYQLAVEPLEKLESERLQDWRTRFPNVERAERLQHEDDRGSNQFCLAEAFVIDGFLAPHADPRLCTFHAPPSNTIFSVLQVPAHQARRTPFALPYPCEIVHTLEVESPALQPMAIPRFYRETDFMRFSRRERGSRGNWSMTVTLTTLSDSVPAPMVQEHRNVLGEIWGETGCSLNIPKGYRHPRQRSDFGKVSRFAPLPARAVAAIAAVGSPRSSVDPSPLYWPGDMTPELQRQRRRRRRGLKRKDWIWLASAVCLALLFSLLLYVMLPKSKAKDAKPETHDESQKNGPRDPYGSGS
jgi:hypothetical protein